MKSLTTKRVLQIVILSAVSLIITIIYASLCFNRNIWTDEAFTIDMLEHYLTYGDIAAYTATDVHPPLYYFFLKFVTDIFGRNWTLIKMLSIVPMGLIFVLSITYVRKRFSFWTALLFILFTVGIPCTMEYAVQMRMYSLCMFFVTLAALFAFDAYETGRIRSFILMTIGGVGAAYSHYFAFAAVLWIYGILFLAILIRKRELFPKWIIFAILSVALYIPWIPSFLGQIGGVSESYWIPEITFSVLAEYFPFLFGSDYPGLSVMFGILILLAAFLFTVLAIRKKGEGKLLPAFYAFLIPILVILTGVILSMIIRPVFIIRYALPTVPLIALSLAITFGFMETSSKSVLTFFLCISILLSYKCTYYDEYESTYTDKTLDFLEENMADGDIIVYNYKIYDFIYGCYFPENRLVYIDDLDYSSVSGNIWFLQTVYNPNLNPEKLSENNLVSTYCGDFGIEQNEFWIWKVAKL